MTTSARRQADTLLLSAGAQPLTSMVETFGQRLVRGAVKYGTWIQIDGSLAHKDWRDPNQIDVPRLRELLREIDRVLAAGGTP